MKKNGFTLIEVIIAMTILSIAILPFMSVLTQNLKASIITKEKYTGSHYAKALAEEIKLRHFGVETATIPLWSGNFDRTTYDTIDNYNEFDEKTRGGITDLSGNLVDGNYFRKVKVDPVDSINLQPISSGTVENKKITVECWVQHSTTDEAITIFEFYISAGG